MKSMDIRALLLIHARQVADCDPVALAGPHLALLDVVGKNAAVRTVERLQQAGISQISAVMEKHPVFPPGRMVLPRQVDGHAVAGEFFWRTAENVFHRLAQGGAELALVIRLGAYAEINVQEFVKFHLQRSCGISRVADEAGAVEVFCVSAARRNEAAALFRAALSPSGCEYPVFPHAGYVNPLGDARDLRQFAVDALTLKTQTRPAGRQARPGVWIADGARTEDGSRILAPAFLGASSQIRAGALVTRCAAIEHHARVDCGTAVENSTVLAHCYVGAGLDLAHCVAGMGQIANLRRNATVAVTDRKLIGQVASGASRRLFHSAWATLSSISLGIRGCVLGEGASRRRGLETAEPASSPSREGPAGFPEPAQETNVAGEFASRLVVARRYGDQ